MSDNSYYQIHAQSFFQGTVNVDMQHLYARFLPHIKQGGLILDAGCGSGRDTKVFLAQGFKVQAIDASAEMARLASIFTGIEVQQCSFQQINQVDVYDAIWCCASLLHVPFNQLVDVFKRLATALKEQGLCYVSFKYGERQRVKEGRHFTDLTEQSFQQLISQIPELAIDDLWVTQDARPDRAEQWLNALLTKRLS